MQGKAEHYMATAINFAGCALTLKGYAWLAVSCWVAGVAWKIDIVNPETKDKTYIMIVCSFMLGWFIAKLLF